MRTLVVGPTGRTGNHVIDALARRAPEISLRGLCRYSDQRPLSIEVMPGHTDGGARLAQAIEVIPGHTDGARSLARSIETVPGHTDGGNRLARSIETVPGHTDGGGNLRSHRIDCLCGDLENPVDRAAAVEGIDAVVHYAPAFHPREAAMGTGMIDAAVTAGVKRFIYVSALHAQATGVPGNGAKLAVEGHLAEVAAAADLEWTILRPQTYMQNIDVAAAVASGTLACPCSTDRPQSYLDLADLAEVVARILVEDGHAFATYDLANDESLSTTDIALLVSRVSGHPITAAEISPQEMASTLQGAGPGYAHVAEAMQRLTAWQVRSGGRGNAGALRALLGRAPTRFEDYVRRCLPTA